MKRIILVILSNRFLPSKPIKYVELDCKSDGTILKQRFLKSKPRKPAYDEVWQNDEGKATVDDCTSIKRKYRHPLEKPRR
jgi:hypothetical protein